MRTERTEWRVETEMTEDDFGTDEADARRWAHYAIDARPTWAPVRLLKRTVIVEESDWEIVVD